MLYDTCIVFPCCKCLYIIEEGSCLCKSRSLRGVCGGCSDWKESSNDVVRKRHFYSTRSVFVHSSEPFQNGFVEFDVVLIVESMGGTAARETMPNAWDTSFLFVYSLA